MSITNALCGIWLYRGCLGARWIHLWELGDSLNESGRAWGEEKWMCSFHLEEVAPYELMGTDILIQCSPGTTRCNWNTLASVSSGTNTKMRNQELLFFMPPFMLASGIPFLWTAFLVLGAALIMGQECAVLLFNCSFWPALFVLQLELPRSNGTRRMPTV